ncbi:sugar transport protein MST1-like [Phragmites australis]|uniref:sugar transport protein MST1-like n=1 Tax=Phragmites australis TaxID=29695 RepID=UPI002D798ED0|nr:sugar transport protein MST1-like [Phragmites australis]XP_062219404.1 sugar transport protein MST1-like [Phragmites australis]
MQSSVMAFFPNIATAKLELHYLYRKYVNMFGISSNNSTVGCHLTRKMSHLPVQLIDRTFFSTGTAIRSIAISYGALILRWLLNKTSAVQRTLISRAMRSLSCWCGSLPFFVSIGFLISRLYSYAMIHNHTYGRQFILGHNANLQGESTMGMEKSELCNEQPFLSSLLGHKRDYVRLALQCICYPASLKVVDITQKKPSYNRPQRIRSGHDTSAFWRIISRNEQYLAYMMVLAALQLFLLLARVNVTTLFLPMLSPITSSKSSAAVIGNIMLVLVNSCGILGSALAAKQYGREVTFTIGVILMVFCQVAIPLILEVQIGVGGGTRTPMGYTTTMFVLTCVISCGLSWSWGSFFWTIPGKKVHSAGQVLTIALNFGVCFAQMQYFLLVLCRLKNVILVYYAMWIWS